MVPTLPTTNFVMRQTHLALARLKHLLHAMPPAVDLDQLFQRRLRRRFRQGVPRLRRLIHGAHYHQTLTRSRRALVFSLYPGVQGPYYFRTLRTGASMDLTPTTLRLRRAHSSTRRHGGQRFAAAGVSLRSRIKVLLGTSST